MFYISLEPLETDESTEMTQNNEPSNEEDNQLYEETLFDSANVVEFAPGKKKYIYLIRFFMHTYLFR